MKFALKFVRKILLSCTALILLGLLLLLLLLLLFVCLFCFVLFFGVFFFFLQVEIIQTGITLHSLVVPVAIESLKKKTCS